jgi:hypothetical protein
VLSRMNPLDTGADDEHLHLFRVLGQIHHIETVG